MNATSDAGPGHRSVETACLRAFPDIHYSCTDLLNLLNRQTNRLIREAVFAPDNLQCEGFSLRRVDPAQFAALKHRRTLNTCFEKRLLGGILMVFIVLSGAVNASTSRFPELYELTLEELLHIRVMDFFQHPSLLIELPLEELLDIRAVRIAQDCNPATDEHAVEPEGRKPR